MTHLADIPNEVLQQVFSHLPLKGLIAARGVNKRWRQLIPHGGILPARRALLDLYLTILKSPLFTPTRSFVLSNLQPFDRQGYLDRLLNNNNLPQQLKDHLHLPEEFCLWVLEWPASVALQYSWPGLPFRCHHRHLDDGSPQVMTLKDDGSPQVIQLNWLQPKSVRIAAIDFTDFLGIHHENVPVLYLRASLDYDGTLQTWLVFDKKDSLRGKVYELYTSYNGVAHRRNVRHVSANFIEWQRRLWDMELESASGGATGTSSLLSESETESD